MRLHSNTLDSSGVKPFRVYLELSCVLPANAARRWFNIHFAEKYMVTLHVKKMAT